MPVVSSQRHLFAKPHLYTTIGMVSLDRNQEALVALDHTLALEPNNAAAWYLKGICFSRLNRNEEALVALDHTLALDPNNAAAWYLKGVSLIQIDLAQSRTTLVTSDDVLTPASSTNIIHRKVDVFRALGKEKEARRAESKSKKHSK